ncbi:MAG: LbtU family siderophore porin [Proteobacteria bacterium]|nr:LbtU family siderophore porin [Pseudomonadota bacterium]
MMKLVRKKIIFTLTFVLFVFATISIFSASAALADEALEKRVKTLEKHQGELYKSLKEKKSPGHMQRIADNISLGGLVEVEAFHESANDTTSGIVAATVEIAIDAEINENVNTHILLLWEESGAIDMDEATIEITTPYGMVATLGKLYVPFGVFNSHFISDPMTLELGETNESALLLSYEKDIFSGSIAIFNGGIDDTNDDVIDDYVLSVTATPRKDLTVGASLISDIAEGDLGLTGASTIDKVAGIGFSATFEIDRFTIEGEYIGALEDFNVADLDVDGDGNGDRPSAFNLEVAYAVNDRLSVAGKYEANNDMFDFPESQIGAVASYELYDHTAVAIELLHGEFAMANLDDRDVLTAQIAVEF